MGVFVRKDSPYFWLRLNGYRDFSGNQLRESTRVRCDAPSTEQRKKDRALAEQLFYARMHELASGAASPDTKPAILFGDFLTWWETHTLPRRKGKERESYVLPRLRKAFGKLPLSAIDQHRVVEWRTERLAVATEIVQGRRRRVRKIHAGPSTVNREVALLKSIIQAAVPKYLDSSPLYGMKQLRVEKPKRRGLSVEEEDRLLRVLAPADRAIVIMGLDTLCRLSDILNLRREDDHGDTLYIRDPKDPRQSKPYTVPVSKRLRKALDAVKRSNPSEYIFAHRRIAKTERDRRHTIQQMLERACAKTDPPIPYGRANGGITFHWATRRTGASRMIANNIDPKTVQRLGHWATAELVLDIYSEAVDENTRKAVEVPGRRRRVRSEAHR